MGVGTKIKELIKERKMTIKQLAELTGIPVNTLYSIIKRDSERVRAETVQILADKLFVTPTYLIGFDDKIIKPEQYSHEELAEIKAGAWAAYKGTAEQTLLSAFVKLNPEGQQKAIERVEELTEIPKYRNEQKKNEVHDEVDDEDSYQRGYEDGYAQAEDDILRQPDDWDDV